MKEEIKALKNGECYIVPESDYGKAQVWKINDKLILFSIPYAGGDPTFEKVYSYWEIDILIKTINSWT